MGHLTYTNTCMQDYKGESRVQKHFNHLYKIKNMKFEAKRKK